jgi:hypothetical protein
MNMKKPEDHKAEESKKPENEQSGAGSEVRTGIVKLGEAPRMPATPSGEPLRQLSAGHGIQALWATLLPLLGVGPATPGEFPGVFQVEPVPGKDEAMIHIDIPNKPYEKGTSPAMDRVVTLTVRMEHDFRKLGDRYYCIDCEAPNDETRH